ncbi:MAG: hypothetical protein ACRD9S_24905 [Pyrinomonadaceae bacterium]
MLETGTLQSQRSQNLISTSMPLDSFSEKPKVTASHLLLPEVGNRRSSLGTLEISRVPERALNKLLDKKTGPLGIVPQARTSFKALESWVGRVMEVDQNNSNFTAMVISELHSETREVAEFTFEEISEDDQSLVKPGAMFYWSVGYQINEFNGRSTASTLRFKRLRHWTRKELEHAEVRAEEYSDWFVRGSNGPANASSPG